MGATLGEKPFDVEDNIKSDTSVLENILATLTFDRKVLISLPYQPRNTNIALLTIILSAILDFSGVLSFNLRFIVTDNGTLTFLHPFIQILAMYYSAWLIRKSIQLLGNDVSTIQVFRLLGYSVIWSVVGWILLFVFSFAPAVYPLLYFSTTLLVILGYSMVLVLGLSSARSYGDYLTAILFMAIYLIMGLLFPIFLINVFLG